MREIKFRAWDNVKDRMYFVGEEDDVSFELCSDGSFVGHDLKEDWDSPFQRLEHLQYMQYTGLKDKNGVGIYEGDIVRYSYGEGPSVSTFDGGHDVIDPWSEEEVSEVSFIRGSFLIGKHLMWAIEEMEMDYSIEIIGNIYEHPHMLEGEL